jgi:predicted MFS family arabinose efflux permease
MTVRQLKFGYYSLTALNTLATSYFLNYLFFYLRDHFGFENRHNLWISALHGFIYIFSAWQCGKFAQHRGFNTSLKIGFAGLALCMITGGLLNSKPGIIAALIGYSIVLLFTWPALEALTSENEPPERVPHMVGIYNCTWSGAAALAYFSGGKLYDSLGAGAVFWIPAAIFFAEFILVLWLAREARLLAAGMLQRKTAAVGNSQTPVHPEPAAFRQSVSPETFLKLAWLANPFAYVAVNTLFAVMPGLAIKLGLSPTKVGLFCSVWLFGRLGAFITLWQWTGWHYRFRWMVAGFILLIASFMLILLASKLWIVVVAQIFFGFAAGLMYYASLFYSMDVGEASASHGGLHEAAIGLGVCLGTGVGAASLQFFRQFQNAGAYAVSGLLVIGFVALITIWARAKRIANSQ